MGEDVIRIFGMPSHCTDPLLWEEPGVFLELAAGRRLSHYADVLGSSQHYVRVSREPANQFTVTTVWMPEPAIPFRGLMKPPRLPAELTALSPTTGNCRLDGRLTCPWNGWLKNTAQNTFSTRPLLLGRRSCTSLQKYFSGLAVSELLRCGEQMETSPRWAGDGLEKASVAHHSQ